VAGDRLDAARALLPGVQLTDPRRLGGNDRSVVHRVRATWPDGAERSLIVKEYVSSSEGWVREAAALAVLAHAGRRPRLVVESAEPPVIVTQDVGSGDSVADALLGDGPRMAERMLRRWAEAMADLHVATRATRADFRAALAEREGELPVRDASIALDLENAARVLDRECGSLGVRIPTGALDELRALGQRLGGDGLAALTPADACPDNNVVTDTGLVLVDFEGAQWRHVAWDVAYLLVPWPSCWCSWRLPDDVAARAVAAYRAAAATGLPGVDAPEFERDVEAAVIGWALVSTAWFIGNALGDDPQLHPDRPTPTRRAKILQRLDRARPTGEIPALSELASLLAAELRNRWGDVPLDLAPAFQADQ
jgi:hypothetical protein